MYCHDSNILRCQHFQIPGFLTFSEFLPPCSLYLSHRHTSTDLETEARKKGLGQGYGTEIGIQAPDPHSHPSTALAALLIPQDSAAIVCLERRTENGEETGRLALFVY